MAHVNPFRVFPNIKVSELSGQKILPFLNKDPAWLDSLSMGFDGIDDNISTTGGWPELAATGTGYTVSWWMKAVVPLVHNNYLFTISDTSNIYRLQIRTSGTAGSLVIYEGNADTLAFSGGGAVISYLILDEFWHHYVFSSPGDGGTFAFYIDGYLAGSAAGRALGGTLATTRLFMASNYSFGSDFGGSFDEFSIFSAELNYSQAIALFNGGVPTDLSPLPNLQHWWRMGDGTGDTALVIYDQVGSWDLNAPVNVPVLQADVPHLIATQVDPYYGDTGGSTSIAITGSNLADVSAVSVGGNPASVTSVSANSVMVDTPAGAAGAVDIIITDSTNYSAVTLPDGFVYRTGAVPAWANASSVEFNGVNAFGSTEAWPELADSGSGYTVSFWFKGVLPVSHNDYVFAISDTSNIYRLRISTIGTTGTLVIYEGNADTLAFSAGGGFPPAVLVDANWHHYVVASPGDGGTLYFYIDGVLAGSAAGRALGSDLADTRLWLGSAVSFGANIAGNIDEFGIFGAELGYSAVTALFNGGIPTDLSLHPDLEHYWRMGDSIGDTASLIRDQTGGMDLDLTEGTPVIDPDVPYLIVLQADPYYGDATTGGAAITITGSNLANVSAIAAGGNAFAITGTAASSVTATMAANLGVDAVVDLVITDATNSSAVTVPNGFVYRTGAVPAWVNTYSVELDGSSALASSETWPELADSGSGYTVSFWFKAVLPLVHNNYLFTISDTSNKFRLRISTIGTTGTLAIYEGNADTLAFSSGGTVISYLILDEFWHHYVFSSPGDGGTFAFYVDAVSTATPAGRALGSDLAATKLWVGSNYAYSSNIAGNFDEFAIFGAELGYSAVTALFNGGIPTDLSLHPDLEHYWRMGDSIGDTASLIRDQTGGMDLDLTEGTPVIDPDVPYLIVIQADPYYGDATTGGAAITITGSNLANVSAISAGGNAFAITGTAASSVTATMAANLGVDAVVDLVITDATNSSAVTVPNGFVYRTGAVPAWVNTYSVELDGSSALASSETWPELADSGSGYTVSFWFKAVLPLVHNNYLFTISDTSNKFRLRISTSGTTGTLAIYEGNADTLAFSSGGTATPAVLVDALWHHYVVASPGDGGTFAFYVDAVSTATPAGRALGSDLAATKLWVGSNYAYSSNIAGNFDEFAIFGAELPATGPLSVASLYNLGTPADLNGLAGLQHYWRMGDSIGDTASLIRDQTGGMDLDLTEGTPVIDPDVP